MLREAAVAVLGEVHAVKDDRNIPHRRVTEESAAALRQFAVERRKRLCIFKERLAFDPRAPLHERRRDEQQRQVAVPQPVEKTLHPPGGLGRGRATQQVVRAEHDAEAVRREPRGNLPQKYAHREIRNGNLAAVFAEVFDLPRIAKEGRPPHALGIAAAAERSAGRSPTCWSRRCR